MRKDTLVSNGLSIGSKSGIPIDWTSSVVGTMLGVVVKSSGDVVGWLGSGDILDGWSNLNDWRWSNWSWSRSLDNWSGS